MFSKALFKQSCKANGVMWANNHLCGVLHACVRHAYKRQRKYRRNQKRHLGYHREKGSGSFF